MHTPHHRNRAIYLPVLDLQGDFPGLLQCHLFDDGALEEGLGGCSAFKGEEMVDILAAKYTDEDKRTMGQR